MIDFSKLSKEEQNKFNEIKEKHSKVATEARKEYKEFMRPLSEAYTKANGEAWEIVYEKERETRDLLISFLEDLESRYKIPATKRK